MNSNPLVSWLTHPDVRRGVAAGFPTVMDADEPASELQAYGLVAANGTPVYANYCSEALIRRLEAGAFVRDGVWVSEALALAYTPLVAAYVDYLRRPCTYRELRTRWPTLPDRSTWAERMAAMLAAHSGQTSAPSRK